MSRYNSFQQIHSGGFGGRWRWRWRWSWRGGEEDDYDEIEEEEDVAAERSGVWSVWVCPSWSCQSVSVSPLFLLGGWWSRKGWAWFGFLVLGFLVSDVSGSAIPC